MRTGSSGMLRERTGPQRVTNVELFFDLVYVFAATQISHYLLANHTAAGALRAAVLLAIVWLLWVYTTWAANWLDPNQIPVRILLLGVAIVSLVMSAAMPTAFGRSGLVIGIAYLVIQVGRTGFVVLAVKDEGLRRNFQRITAWCVISGAIALGGGLAHGLARELLWAGAVGVDLLGGAVGFYTPGLGRSVTSDWTIEGNHFAERCQGFILIALGESIVVIGAALTARLASAQAVTWAEIVAFGVAVVASMAFWWLYFDRSAEDAANVIARSADPGRLGRSAYHFVHPIMVAGIIVAAAGDAATADAAAAGAGHRVAPWTAWLILGGPATFVAGHAAFKATVWHRVSWPRIVAIAVLGLLGLLAPHVTAVLLSALSAAVVVAVAVADQIWRPPRGRSAESAEPAEPASQARPAGQADSVVG